MVAKETGVQNPDMRVGWLIWETSLTEFLYFEEPMRAPRTEDYKAEWNKTAARGARKPSVSLSIYDKKTGEYIFYDCSDESPKGRRSLCYDHEALEARKEHKPADSAIKLAEEMGVEILNEEQYRELQKLGEFDTKTSSWVETPAAIRKLGGAVFCDRRYGQVFLYHNGAESYYAARGFRGSLRV